MPLCSVITCKCSQEGHNGAAEGLSFHLFPANVEIKSKWVDMTGRDGWVPTSEDFICSRHFRDNDYFIKRSGKRYLKTSAIPCEYVVYRDLYFDEDVDVKFEADEAEASVASEDQAQEPELVLIPDQEPEDNIGVTEQPGTSRAFAPFNLPPTVNQEVATDSTFGTIYDLNENGAVDWEQFRPERIFGRRFPTVSMLEENSQDVGSSGFDERYRRDDGAIEATFAELKDAQKIKILLESGQMTEYDKAAAIMAIQSRQIVKLKIKNRRIKKTLKRISAVLRNVEIQFFFKLIYLLINGV